MCRLRPGEGRTESQAAALGEETDSKLNKLFFLLLHLLRLLFCKSRSFLEFYKYSMVQ